MKTKILIIIIILMMCYPDITLNLTYRRVGSLDDSLDFEQINSAIWVNDEHLAAFTSHQEVKKINTVYKDTSGKEIIMADAADIADYVYGKWYQEEYLVDLYNLYDWDVDFKKSKRVKGFTRNYFSAEDGGVARLLKKVTGSSRHEYVDCLWYVDEICVNDRNPAYEFLFRMHEGSYKIEARSNDTILISFMAVFPESLEVVFKPGSSYDGEYGFDDNKYEVIARLNDAEYLDEKFRYAVPFISMQQNQTILIDAYLMYKKNIDNKEALADIPISFEPSSPDIKISRYENNASREIIGCKVSDFKDGKITLAIRAEDIVENGFINVRMHGELIGKINMEARRCLGALDLILVKVVINDGLGDDIDLEDKIPGLHKLLNEKSFNQAFVHWNIDRIETLKLYIDKAKVSLLDVYREAVKHYKDNDLNKDNSTIMFVSDSELTSDASGYAYVSKSGTNRYSIVRSNAIHNRTPVHELAHNLGLKDLSSEFKAYFYDTDNFMDYYSVAGNDNRRMFWKHQWKQIYEQVYNHQRKKMLCDSYSG